MTTKKTDETKPKKVSKKKVRDEKLEALKAKGVVRTKEQSRLALRKKVRIFYDLQRMRLQVSGRIQPKAEGAEIQIHEYDLATLEKRTEDLHNAEKLALADVEEHLQTLPFWVKVLSDKDRFKGIGPTMAGVILSEFDVERADTVSKFWAFAGLAPMAAWRCTKCNTVVDQEEEGSEVGPFTHTRAAAYIKGEKVKCPYENQSLTRAQVYPSGKTMKPVRGEKLVYNSFLRSKLVGVLGPILLKVDSPYRKFYDDYKNRWIAAGKGRNDGHRHMAAIRYMVKMLLVDIYNEWRTLEGLPIRPPYAEEKLGHKHVGGTTQNTKLGNGPMVSQEEAEVEEELKRLGTK